MDNISTANGIIWIFILISALCSLPSVCTLFIWADNKKVFLVAYIINTILMGIISFINLQALFFSDTYENKLLSFLPIGKTLTILTILSLIGSIILLLKNNLLCKILNTISTIMGVIVFICYLKFYQ